MGQVIEFKTDRNIIEFKDFVKEDYYLRLTCINALSYAGYEVNPNGVKEFQREMDLEPTGIIGTDELGLLITVFDPEKTQEILNYINKLNKPKKKIPTWKYVWYLGWLALFTVWGFCSFWSTVYHFILNLIR